MEEILKLETAAETSAAEPERAEVKNRDRTARLLFAVPVSEGRLCSHFGHCDEFALIETEQG